MLFYLFHLGTALWLTGFFMNKVGLDWLDEVSQDLSYNAVRYCDTDKSNNRKNIEDFFLHNNGIIFRN